MLKFNVKDRSIVFFLVMDKIDLMTIFRVLNKNSSVRTKLFCGSCGCLGDRCYWDDAGCGVSNTPTVGINFKNE